MAQNARTFHISCYLEMSAVFRPCPPLWQLSKLSAKWMLLDTACMMSAALNVSNSNKLQNPYKKGFKFIVFSCHHCHTWKGKRGTGKFFRNIYKIFKLRKQICCPVIGRGKMSLMLKSHSRCAPLKCRAPLPSILNCAAPVCLFVCSGTCEVIEQKVQQCE